MKDDEQERTAETEAAVKKAKNVSEAVQKENQQKIEQLNVRWI